MSPKDTDITLSPLQEAVGNYKKDHPTRENVDAQFVLDTLEKANNESCVFVALNPILKDNWQENTPMWGIRNVYLSEDRKLIFRVRKDKETYSAGKLYEEVADALKTVAYKKIAVQYELKEERFDITDVFGHFLFRDKMAGLPFDIVLARVEKQ